MRLGLQVRCRALLPAVSLTFARHFFSCKCLQRETDGIADIEPGSRYQTQKPGTKTLIPGTRVPFIPSSPSGLVGSKSSVRVFVRRFSPVPSIHTYEHCTCKENGLDYRSWFLLQVPWHNKLKKFGMWILNPGAGPGTMAFHTRNEYG